MAEAVLEIVLNNLSSLIQKELGLFLGFKKDFKSLSSLITTIKATLQDAEEKQFTDNAIKDWLLKLKDAAYVLDDILDECATNALELEHKGSKGGLTDKVRSSFLSSLNPKQVAFRYKIAKKMKSIRERLDEIAAERTKFHLTEIVREKRSGVLDRRQTTSIISQPKVYGRDEDKDKIVDCLVGEASGLEDLCVYPIVGLGGLGKTTLAQLIFNHKRVVKHFEMRMWVCVSEDFSLKRMIKAIIEAATKKSCDDLELDPLQRRLQDILQGKRFLLVLDDVWDDKQENWQRLTSVLDCGGKGASILVTTRLAKVAKIMPTIHPHDISKLSDKDCWELFKERAFERNEVERPELVVIGKEILKKCGGVPLAAIALGSLLRFKRQENEWHYVKESKLWSLQDEDNVMPALRLSYLNLPFKLRQCFAFCALFPKDEIISKQFLIELWIANGFISSNKMLDGVDIGNEVWNELYWRSFFQDFKRDVFGEIISFKMHDLVHDLAQSISEEVCCITAIDDMPSTFERIRHLSISVDSILMPSVKSLRTYTKLYVHDYPPNVFKFRSLRVLKLTYIQEISSLISHLKCLRYLDLSNGAFETLPESICKLWNLQILKLDFCYRLRKLPNHLIQLKSLQHLSLNDCLNLSNLPPNIGKMTSLRTLSMYVVGKGNVLAELGQLNFKVDRFHIKHLERVKSVDDAKEANMLSKHVNNLRLSWERTEESQLQENVEQILEVLQPFTQQLQELCVEGYTGSYFPEWMSSPSLIHLQKLRLKNCKSCLHLPQLEKLPSLNALTILGCSELEIDDLGKLPSLEVLDLVNLPNLTSLSMMDGEMTIRGKCNHGLLSSIHKLGSLESLELDKIKELKCFPDGMLRNLTSLKKLLIFRCSEIEGLGEALQDVTALQSLNLFDLPNLTSLPDSLGNLSSLQHLHISNCPKLICLPASIQSLTALKDLKIVNCPELGETV
jgi:Leucine-rich repeat (LRR) protein